MKKTAPVCVRNLRIGEGRPKICVPIVGKTKAEILKQAERLRFLPADLAEWRADWYDDVFFPEFLLDTLKELRSVLPELPLLFTFRTLEEGGEKEISAEQYESCLSLVSESGLADLIDIELFRGDDVTARMISKAHSDGLKVILSSHEFTGTPAKQEIIHRLCKMQDLGADLPKIAVMPTHPGDVLTLLQATLEMAENFADRPIITMSMSGTGVVSRLAGETFGSAITFGSADRASAPGQIPAEQLKQILDLLHQARI